MPQQVKALSVKPNYLLSSLPRLPLLKEKIDSCLASTGMLLGILACTLIQ